jgi:hypothetical protein
MINKGAPLSTLTYGTVSLVEGQASYTLPNDVVDIMSLVYRKYDTVSSSFNNDRLMDRIGLFEYNELSAKTNKGQASQYVVDRARVAPIVTLYPVPDNSDDELGFYYISRLEDASALNQDIDVSHRYIPSIINGLVYHVSKHYRSSVSPDERAVFKQEYEMALQEAMEEDRERVSYMIRYGR